jgi:hypothetical protein
MGDPGTLVAPPHPSISRNSTNASYYSIVTGLVLCCDGSQMWKTVRNEGGFHEKNASARHPIVMLVVAGLLVPWAATASICDAGGGR